MAKMATIRSNFSPLIRDSVYRDPVIGSLNGYRLKRIEPLVTGLHRNDDTGDLRARNSGFLHNVTQVGVRFYPNAEIIGRCADVVFSFFSFLREIQRVIKILNGPAQLFVSSLPCGVYARSRTADTDMDRERKNTRGIARYVRRITGIRAYTLRRNGRVVPRLISSKAYLHAAENLINPLLQFASKYISRTRGPIASRITRNDIKTNEMCSDKLRKLFP